MVNGYGLQVTECGLMVTGYGLQITEMSDRKDIFSFENLEVYKKARKLIKDVYLLQNTFPKEEKYALGDQI